MAHGMDATHNRNDQQLVREARIGLTAIGAAILLFFGVAFWRLGPLASISSPAPPTMAESLAAVPMDIASHSQQPSSATARPEIVRAATETDDQRAFAPSPAVPATFEQPIVEPPTDSTWQPPTDPSGFLPNPRTIEDGGALPIPAPLSPIELPPSLKEIRDPQLNRIPTGAVDENVPPASEQGFPLVPPAPPEPGTVIIGPGDTFFKIAERVYGSGDYYKALYQHNRDRYRRPDRLPIGDKVRTPPVEELQRRYPELCPVE